MSIYERLGGERGVGTAVDDFYQRVLADPHLVSYFDGVDMGQLRAHQTKLLVQLTGGPANYGGRDLAAAHAGLDITSRDFDRLPEHLAGTLTHLGVDEGTVSEVGATLTAYRDDIIARTGLAS